jgi:hypothetical protein
MSYGKGTLKQDTELLVIVGMKGVKDMSTERIRMHAAGLKVSLTAKKEFMDVTKGMSRAQKDWVIDYVAHALITDGKRFAG